MAALNRYADTLTDWALATSRKMLVDVSTEDYRVWMTVGQKISRETRKKLRSAGSGDIFTALQSEQVALIKSIPTDAAKKVQEWTKQGLADGTRYEEIAKRIFEEIGGVTRSRAELIARTETARARTNFTQARARSVGSPGYIWHTVGDGRVRPMHAALDKTYHDWNDPPVCDISSSGPLRSHPGAIFNCRCWAEPVWPKSEYEK